MSTAIDNHVNHEMCNGAADYRIPGHYEYRGVVFGEATQGVTIDMCDGWTANPNEILISTYPKSGTTWMAGILPLIMNNGDKQRVDSLGHMVTRVPYVEVSVPGVPSSLSLMAEGKPASYIKTHLMYEYFKRQIENNGLKVVLVVRNPKDVLVSFYHMYKNQPVLGPYPGTFHDYFQLYKAKKLLFGDPIEWMKDWFEKRDRGSFFVCKYEDMIKDCSAVVQKLAAFCGRELDDEVVMRIVDQCAMGNMKKDPMMLIQSERLNTADLKFFRKGMVGDWKNYFTQEESDYVDEQCKKLLDPIGLRFDYE